MRKKPAYQQKLETQLDEWQAKIHILETNAPQVSADMKIQYEEQIQDLKAKQEAAQEKLKEIQEANKDAWENLGQRLKGARDKLGQAIKETTSRFIP